MARLYSNENFALPVVEELRRLGHDVLTVAEADNAEQAIPDDMALEFAREQDRILLTLNRKDFIRLHREHPDHAGIIVCTFDIDFIGQAGRIHAALSGREEMRGELVRVNRPA